jgi:two-component system chemotaxis response regulator CheB
MPPLFTSHLAQQLAKRSTLDVREGVDNAAVEPGQAWVAPGNRHMIVTREGDQVRLGINSDPPENSCRPSVDVLFSAMAEVYGAHTLAVVLTGMGNDGYRGAGAIHEAGGRILAQDRSTSVVWGMPSFIANNGLADRVLPLDFIAPELLRRLDLLRND